MVFSGEQIKLLLRFQEAGKRAIFFSGTISYAKFEPTRKESSSALRDGNNKGIICLANRL
jgi:hypothetical protein